MIQTKQKKEVRDNKKQTGVTGILNFFGSVNTPFKAAVMIALFFGRVAIPRRDIFLEIAANIFIFKEPDQTVNNFNITWISWVAYD